MILWFNLILAWAAVALAALLVIIWALRLINKKLKIAWIKKLNSTLRKHHKFIGILLIVVSVIHGILSSEALLSFNWGTGVVIVTILLGLSWMLRKQLQLKKWWMYIHRILTAVFAAMLVIHIVNVGGIMIDDLIAGRISPPSSENTITVIDSDPYTAYAADDPQDDVPAALETLPPTPPTLPAAGTDTSVQNTTIPDTAETPIAATPTPAATSASVYKDGVYTGTGTGYRPGLVVEVVIEKDTIISVTVVSHNEKNEQFWGVPVQLIPQLIVEAQSTSVDTVSGATMTSRGIIAAVNDALEQALN